MGRGSGPEDPPVAKADDRPDQVGKPTLAGTCLLDRDRDQRHRCRSDVPRGTLDQGPPIARYSLYKPLSALGRREGCGQKLRVVRLVLATARAAERSLRGDIAANLRKSDASHQGRRPRPPARASWLC